ncbi:MAG: hypothetical protein IAG13_30715 [Deltaproteobacteria bacterium]|nr:hypothetical protein [Nannocystaceae bacterium]
MSVQISNPAARGMAFLGVFKSLREELGPERLAAYLRGWGPELAELSALRLTRTEWYGYPAFAQLLAGAERDLGDGSGALCRRLGGAAAKRDLGGAFAVLKLLASPQHLIGAAERVWPRYYRDAGRMEAVSTRPTHTVLRIHEFPAMVPEHCRMMEGWMIAAMGVLGATVSPGARETTCMKHGPYHEFTCTWTR